jgi:hypothetical protein
VTLPPSLRLRPWSRPSVPATACSRPLAPPCSFLAGGARACVDFFIPNYSLRERERENKQQRARTSSIQSSSSDDAHATRRSWTHECASAGSISPWARRSAGTCDGTEARRRRAVLNEQQQQGDGGGGSVRVQEVPEGLRVVPGVRRPPHQTHAAAGADAPRPGGSRRKGSWTHGHECAVCGLELSMSMGQALGRHTRRHRGEAPLLAVTDAAAQPDQVMPDLNFQPPDAVTVQPPPSDFLRHGLGQLGTWVTRRGGA